MPLRALIYDAAGNLLMIVRPDDPKQLDDPAFNPPNHTQLRVTVESGDLKTLEQEATKALSVNDPIKKAVDEKYVTK